MHIHLHLNSSPYFRYHPQHHHDTQSSLNQKQVIRPTKRQFLMYLSTRILIQILKYPIELDKRVCLHQKNPPLSPSPTPRVSARNRKPSKKIESQRRRAAEEESEPKKKKICKAKLVDATSQLNALFGSDIEFSA